MKIKELIQKLQEFDQDFDIKFRKTNEPIKNTDAFFIDFEIDKNDYEIGYSDQVVTLFIDEIE